MQDNVLLMEYFRKFKELPPLEAMVSYEHPVYQKLMRIAINVGEEITAEQLDEELKKQDVKSDR